jgi:hypothetical protein
MRALLAATLVLLPVLLLSVPAADAGQRICTPTNQEHNGKTCAEYLDDSWDCGLLGPRCICVMQYEPGGNGSGHCVILPAAE